MPFSLTQILVRKFANRTDIADVAPIPPFGHLRDNLLHDPDFNISTVITRLEDFCRCAPCVGRYPTNAGADGCKPASSLRPDTSPSSSGLTRNALGHHHLICLSLQMYVVPRGRSPSCLFPATGLWLASAFGALIPCARFAAVCACKGVGLTVCSSGKAVPLSLTLRHKYIIHTEGNAESGRLKFHLLCGSVIISHPLKVGLRHER